MSRAGQAALTVAAAASLAWGAAGPTATRAVFFTVVAACLLAGALGSKARGGRQ